MKFGDANLQVDEKSSFTHPPSYAEAVVQRCSVKKVFLEISQNSQENTQKIFHYRCFLVNSAKFLITSFLKNPSDGCFCINTRSVYFPITTFRLFKNDVAHFFSLSIFSVSYVGWEQK